MAKKAKKCEEGAPGWMVTYGDLMSLLLTFFILIVSFSSIQMSEYQKAMGSLKGALGVLKYKQSSVNLSPKKMIQLNGLRNSPSKGGKISDIEKFIKENNLSDSISVAVTKNGIAIRMMSPILFQIGKANLKRSGLPILQKIVELARTFPNKIRVEGHTDNVPIHNSEFPSNWELSAIRAINVIHFFQNSGEISPKRLYYVGYGSNKPLVPNTSEQNRAKNRRVEIYLEKVNPVEVQANPGIYNQRKISFITTKKKAYKKWQMTPPLKTTY